MVRSKIITEPEESHQWRGEDLVLPSIPGMTGPGAGLDILVVDDDQAFLEETVAYLQSLGLRTRGVESAQEAIAIMIGEKPKLTLMDIMLPELTGVRALEIVLALDYRQNIVLMTGSPDAYIAARQVGMGAIDVVKKPLSAKRLRAILILKHSLGKPGLGKHSLGKPGSGQQKRRNSIGL